MSVTALDKKEIEYMERKEYPEVEVTLKELLAAVLHGGRFVVIMGLVLALLLGAYTAKAAAGVNGTEDADYQTRLEEYERSKAVLEEALERSEKELASKMAYMEGSRLMQIDPYNKHTSTIVFAISGVDAIQSWSANSNKENTVSDTVARIQAQYAVLWDSLDLKNAVRGTAYADVENKYLREVIMLEPADGGVLKLTVVGNGEETEKIAANIYDLLVEKKAVVERASCAHDFTVLSEVVTATTIDLDLELLQQEKMIKLETCRTEVESDKAALAALAAPGPAAAPSVAKKAILGGFVGVVLACVYLVGVQLVSSKVSSAQRMARAFELTHFGSVKKPRSIWTMLSQWVMNDRYWKNEAQSLTFIREKGSVHLPEGGTVALLSTLPKVDEKLVEKVKKALEAEGRKVSFAADMLHDPQAVAGIREADALVLLERPFVTENAAVLSAVSLAEEMEKPVCGFVMV